MIKGASLIDHFFFFKFYVGKISHSFQFPDLGGLFSSSLDAKVTPEHLLRLCMEHDHKFKLSHKSAHTYNFYQVCLF